MAMITELRRSVVHHTPHLYSSHPCVVRLINGDLLVVFSQSSQRHPFLHPPADPSFLNLITRSTDLGRTWSTAQVVPGYGWSGVETPGIAQLTNGDVLVNQWQFQWLPLELARKRWRDGTHDFFACRDGYESRHRWHAVEDLSDLDHHPYPYVRTDGQAYVHASSDGGRTWDRTVTLDIAPYQAAYSNKGAVQLSNGDVLIALGSHDHDPLHASFVLRSTDEGRSFGRPVRVSQERGRWFSEPALV